MILVTHGLIGAALGRASGNPLISLAVGFASHFVADNILHWDYPLKSFVRDEKDPMKNDMRINFAFIRDLSFIAIDCISGFALSVVIFRDQGSILPVLAGAVGGVLPDALQFAYFKIRREPLTSLQRFHMSIERETKSPLIGLSTQVASILISVFASLTLF